MTVLSQSTVSNPPGGRCPSSIVETASYLCDLCPFSTKFALSLKSHLRKHAEIVPALEFAGPPDDVSRSFSTTMLSQSAISNPPGGEDPWRFIASVPENARYSCDLCPYSTEFEASLKKHVRSHAGLSPRDTILGAPAIMPSEMESRTLYAPCPRATDDGEADASADVTSADVAQKVSSDPPLGSADWPTTTLHARDGYYTCHVCTYKTRAKCHLVAHLRTHTGETPYRCAICSRSFSQSSNLRRHEMTHSGERPFQCSVCSRTFIQKSHLITHLGMHHEVPSSKSPTWELKQ